MNRSESGRTMLCKSMRAGDFEIPIYAFLYEPGENDRQTEHALGRDLLRMGLRDLYGIEIPEKSPVDSLRLSHGKGEEVFESRPVGKTDMPDEAFCLEKGENGKPYLKNHPDIYFNISHCRGLVVCAFAGRPVGVDVEVVRPVRDSLIRRVLQENEQEILREKGWTETEIKRDADRKTGGVTGRGAALSEDPENGTGSGNSRIGKGEEIEERKEREDRKERMSWEQVFFRYWTLKESYLKRDGSGFTREPREFCFSIDPEDWESPIYGSDPSVACRQTKINRMIGGKAEEFILSVCVENQRGEEQGVKNNCTGLRTTFSAENAKIICPELEIFWCDFQF